MPPPSWRCTLQVGGSNIFLQDSATGASGAVGVEHATCSGKRHFCRMRLFCTLKKHTCLKQNEKNVEMNLLKLHRKNPSKRASVLIFVVVRNFPHANILIFFSYLLKEHNSPLPLPSIIWGWRSYGLAREMLTQVVWQNEEAVRKMGSKNCAVGQSGAGSRRVKISFKRVVNIFSVVWRASLLSRALDLLIATPWRRSF